jgi:hypothetical protein
LHLPNCRNCHTAKPIAPAETAAIAVLARLVAAQRQAERQQTKTRKPKTQTKTSKSIAVAEHAALTCYLLHICTDITNPAL